MGYLNQVQGYREGLLETRSVIKKRQLCGNHTRWPS